MKTTKLATLLAALALSPAFAAETDPVGFVSVTVPAHSDAILAVPLNRAAEFKGVIQSISGNVITVAGTPGWTANAFAPGVTANKTYAVQIASGAKEGLVGRVTANSNNTLTVTLAASDDLTGIGTVAAPVDPDGAGPLTAQSDQIDVMPYWTPSALFGTNAAAGSQFLGFQDANAGINVGNSEQYTCTTPGSWEDDINFGQDATHAVLDFGSGFIIRNNGNTTMSLSFVGSVPMSKHRTRLATKSNNVAQDIAIGFMSPVPEKLSTVGDPTVAVPQQTANFLNFPVAVGDKILGFDNSLPGINKGNSVQFTWNGTEWEDDINFGQVANYQTTLQPGFGYIYRRAATGTANSLVWNKIPAYLQ
ncbi:TIGR02597 family protein [Brevifollis gellanilyticus]|uniref:TIGR02597 family protein n=1 Tax=Brevifollis gellanilyticus TaxID=748831 RepID=A0A512MD37_9BACT|nr:TIGR02597 family protein [Brevifollis gellanilyticus]GEP44638.1 hypothetical protein BGE01nite_39290 [Brevifollis gellanilyticus]